MKTLCLLLGSACLWSTTLAQTDSTAFQRVAPDTTSIDSVQVRAQGVAPDTTSVDSVQVRIIQDIGTADAGRPARALLDSVWHWSGARTLSDVMSMMPEVFVFDLGVAGKPSPYMFEGAEDGWSVPAVDGHLRASPIFGRIRPLSIPVESAERVEMLSGPDALLAGSRWNVVTHQYASPRPQTAIRFVQEPDETIFSDAFFAQNIARSTNLMFGFQRTTSAGRFENARLGSWNLRGRVRSNLTPEVNILFSWGYEKTTNGLNGGVDRVNSPVIFNDVQAIVNEPSAYEIFGREEYVLTGVGRFLPDSSSLTRLTLAQTNEEWEFTRPVAILLFPATSRFAFGRSTDVRFEQSLLIPYTRLRFTAAYRKDRSTGSEQLPAAADVRTTFAGSLEILALDIATPSLAVGWERFSGINYPTSAAELSIRPFSSVGVLLAYEDRPFFPSLHERFWADSLIFRDSPTPVPRERTVRASVRWQHDSGTEGELTLFRKEQSNRSFFFPILTSTTFDPALTQRHANLEITGASLRGILRIGSYAFEGFITGLSVQGPDSLQNIFPRVWARWEVYWQERLFDDNLGLRLGLRGTFFDRYGGIRPDPSSLLEVVERDYPARKITTLDIYGVARIGDALLSLSWENILNIQYYRAASYPMPDRRVVLGVRWKFGD